MLDSLSLWSIALLCTVAGGGAIVIGEVALFALRRWGRKRPIIAGFARRSRVPVLLLSVAVAVQVVLSSRLDGSGTFDYAGGLLLRIFTIITSFWLLGALLFAFEDIVLKRFDVSAADNRKARRARTQIILIRRLTTGALVIIAGAVVLLQFDGARTAGASLLASAGVLSVVAGLAAQSSLANIFAGLQIAFTDALRVDDVVVVDGEWANVEEITLTYTSLKIWDLRRLVVPNTYFTSNNFQNWTRTGSEVLGSVEFDLDWMVPIQKVREEFLAMVQSSELWNKNVAVLQTTDATNTFVRLRILVSAKDGPTLFDLRCAVREHLVVFIRTMYPESLPRMRVNSGADVGQELIAENTTEEAGSHMFSGSPEAIARGKDLTGSFPRIQ